MALTGDIYFYNYHWEIEQIKWSHCGQATKLLTSSELRHKEIIILVLTDSGNLNLETFQSCIGTWMCISVCVLMPGHRSDLQLAIWMTSRRNASLSRPSDIWWILILDHQSRGCKYRTDSFQECSFYYKILRLLEHSQYCLDVFLVYKP